MKTLTYIDCSILVISGVVAFGLSIWYTPLSFCIPSLIIQFVAFGIAFSLRGGSHWPSTLFGCVCLLQIAATATVLSNAHTAFNELLQLLFGLFFVYGFLYLIAAKSFLIRRGYLKPKISNPGE